MQHDIITPEALATLYAQIDDICRQFREIHQEASTIANNGRMPDAALHLNDVLKTTETATNTILDSATAIGAIADASVIPLDAKAKIAEEIGRIYEACSFQDISGQRIQKVLKHLSSLEEQLTHLSLSGSKQFPPLQSSNDGLLNGPELSSLAPSQADIDSMFG